MPKGVPKNQLPISERFWQRVDKSSTAAVIHPVTGEDLGSCWIWTGAKRAGGRRYGVYRLTASHRFSYELVNGPIPEGLHCLHKCDNPICVRPSHLFLGTHLENMKDRSEKGRQPKGEELSCNKLSESEVRDIVALRIANPRITIRSIAKKYGVASTSISLIFNGKKWKHLDIDRVALSEANRIALSPATHCEKGHELTGDNVVWSGIKRFRRRCRVCVRAQTEKRT